MRKIRSDIGDRMPENKKNKSDVSNRTLENNEGDPFKIMENKLEAICLLVEGLSEKDSKFKKLEDELKYIKVMTSFLSKGIIKIDSIKHYNEVIANTEKDLKLLPEVSRADIKTHLNVTPEELIKYFKEYISKYDVREIGGDVGNRIPENKKDNEGDPFISKYNVKKIRRDVRDRIPENKRISNSNEDNSPERNNYRLEVIQSLIGGFYEEKKDPKLKRLEEDLQYLLDTNLRLSEGTIKVDDKLTKTYKVFLEDIKKINFIPINVIIDLIPEELKERLKEIYQ